MKTDIVELIEIDPSSALEVFSSPTGVDPFLAKIRVQIDAFVPIMDTKAGRDEIRSFAAAIVSSKTYLDGMGKTETAKAKELPGRIDASRKRVRDTLDAWRDEVRQPLTDYEDAEKARVAAHAAKIEELSAMASPDASLSIAALESMMDRVRMFDPSGCEEFIDEYSRARKAATGALTDAIAKRKQYEADQAELATLRAAQAAQEAKDREARIASEAADKARAEAAQKFEQEQQAERLKAKAAQDEADRKVREAEEAQRAAERRAREQQEAQSALLAHQAAAQAKREANKRHCAGINRAAVKALVEGGINEEVAKIVVTMIAKGHVPAVSIAY